MNHYVNIMHSFEEKGKDDIPTDEVKEVKKPKKISKSDI